MLIPAAHYVTTSDGYNIAYTVSGSGRPLIFLPLTFSHVQLFWSLQSNLRDWLGGLSTRFQLVQYDGRGQGMSTRGLPANHSVADELLDLDTVAERLALDRFVIMARGPLGHTALRYAAAHPERVEALILFSLPAAGTAWPFAFASRLAEEEWELFLQSFSAFDGQIADMQASIQRMSQTVTQTDWKTLIRHWIASDVRDLLPQVKTPTLVVHPRQVLQPGLQESMNLAAHMPDARFMSTDGAMQLGDPGQGLAAIDEFLDDLPHQSMQPVESGSLDTLLRMAGLSIREIEVLRLLAAGRSNQQIADALVISRNTVRRHVSNVFDKTGIVNRAQAGVYARDHGLA